MDEHELGDLVAFMASDASIELRCPQCAKVLRVPASAAGKNGKCPRCGELVRVPESGRAEIFAAPLTDGKSGAFPKWLWVVIIPAGTMFLCCGGCTMLGIIGGGEEVADSAAPAATKSVAGEVAPAAGAEAEAAAEPTLAVGEQFTLGDFTYVTQDVETRKRLGNEFVNSTANQGASFVLVSFLIRNEGNQTETVLTDDFKIVDQRGREFRPSADATTTLSMSGNSDFLLSQLQPGITKQSMTAFEVPDEVVRQGFTLIVPEKGLLGSDEARIAIRP